MPPNPMDCMLPCVMSCRWAVSAWGRCWRCLLARCLRAIIVGHWMRRWGWKCFTTSRCCMTMWWTKPTCAVVNPRCIRCGTRIRPYFRAMLWRSSLSVISPARKLRTRGPSSSCSWKRLLKFAKVSNTIWNSSVGTMWPKRNISRWFAWKQPCCWGERWR